MGLKISLNEDIICKLYLEGLSLKNIAMIFNCNTEPIRDRLEKNNVRIRSKWKEYEQPIDKVISCCNTFHDLNNINKEVE